MYVLNISPVIAHSDRLQKYPSASSTHDREDNNPCDCTEGHLGPHGCGRPFLPTSPYCSLTWRKIPGWEAAILPVKRRMP